MPALVEAVVARDLLLIRDLLADEVNSHLRNTSRAGIASCKMVGMMWWFVIPSAVMPKVGGKPPEESPILPAPVENLRRPDHPLHRNLPAYKIKNYLRYTSPGLIASCTMVCMMWSFIVTPASTRGDAESVARCMLVDALALLQAA